MWPVEGAICYECREGILELTATSDNCSYLMPNEVEYTCSHCGEVVYGENI